MNILLPYSMNFQDALSFSHYLHNLRPVDRIVFDGSNLSHIEPFGMALVAREIEFTMRRMPETLFFQRNLHHDYARFMGFFHIAGLDHANHNPNFKPGNPRYKQLTRIYCDEVRTRAVVTDVHPNDLIEIEAQNLAKIITKGGSSDVYNSISFATREMMRNVLEHSDSKELLYAAQLWPKRDLAEIAVLDSGIGLQESLRRNPTNIVRSELEALNLAMTPGVSGTRLEEQDREDPWRNSGFGLYMTSRICQEGGSLLLFSGTLGILKDMSGTRYFESTFRGTGIRMTIRPSRIGHLEQSMERYRTEARLLMDNRVPEDLGNSPSTILKRLTGPGGARRW